MSPSEGVASDRMDCDKCGIKSGFLEFIENKYLCFQCVRIFLNKFAWRMICD